MSNEWTENVTGECPVDNDVLVDVKIGGVHASYTDGENAAAWCWEKDGEEDITHWRLHEQPKTLDDALGQQKATCSAEYFDALAHSHQRQQIIYPETTYEPLPNLPSQSSLVASIFNLIYPEPCALREVHVEALKAIVKLVEERGGE